MRAQTKLGSRKPPIRITGVPAVPTAVCGQDAVGLDEAAVQSLRTGMFASDVNAL